MDKLLMTKFFFFSGLFVFLTACGPMPAYQDVLHPTGNPRMTKTQARVLCHQVASEAEIEMESRIEQKRDASAGYKTHCREIYGEMRCETAMQSASSGGFSQGMRDARRIDNAGERAMNACLARNGYIKRRECVANCR